MNNNQAPADPKAEGKDILKKIGTQLKKELNVKEEPKKKVTSFYIEDWINETMRQAEGIEDLTIIKNPAHCTPLNRYDIDKNKLVTYGLPVDSVDRLYRSLFTHSFGIF